MGGESPGDVRTQNASSVVEVYAAHAEPNFRYPYQTAVPEFSHSTAFAVEGKLLVTNAHCVAFTSHVQVKRRDQDTRFTAKVICIGFECDLALLSVADDSFWSGLDKPITFSEELPAFGDTVTVLGFGMGGDNLCTTQGVVSRVDVQAYPPAKRRAFNYIQLPVIQIDAAINYGNSGGPALGYGGYAIGVAFMGMDQAQNVGFIIPAKVVLHFIDDFRRHGRFTKFGYPPFNWQNLETTGLRDYHDVAGRGGVRVTKVDPNVDSGLEVNDVVLELFGQAVGFDGKVAVPLGRRGDLERVSLWALFCDKFTGDPCECLVRRQGKDVRLSFPLIPFRPLIPLDPDVENEYLLVAGVVLQPLTTSYLSDAEAWGSFEVQRAMRSMWDGKVEGRQVLVVTDTFSHEVNAGVTLPPDDVLLRVNGVTLRNLAHLAEILDSSSEVWLRLEFSSGLVMVLRSADARASTEDLLDRHGLVADRHLRAINPTAKL